MPINYLGILAKLEQEPSVRQLPLLLEPPMSGSNSNALVVQRYFLGARTLYLYDWRMADVFRISEDPRHPFRE